MPPEDRAPIIRLGNVHKIYLTGTVPVRSRGEQQRVAIARCLANNPDIILLDEPTGDLDRASGRQVMELLSGLSHDQKKTLIMVTHDPAIAAYADLILLMEDGRIVGQRAPREVAV